MHFPIGLYVLQVRLGYYIQLYINIYTYIHTKYEAQELDSVMLPRVKAYIYTDIYSCIYIYMFIFI